MMGNGSAVELRDVADGLWLWRQSHPDWHEGGDWAPEVASFAVSQAVSMTTVWSSTAVVLATCFRNCRKGPGLFGTLRARW